MKNWGPPYALFALDKDDPEQVEDNSPSRLEWLRQKHELGEKNATIDRIMCMVGLENVKRHFLQVKARIDAARQRDKNTWTWISELRLDLILRGGLGTGKKTIASLYVDFLLSLHIFRPSGVGDHTSITHPLPKATSPVSIYHKAHIYSRRLDDIVERLYATEDQFGPPISVYLFRKNGVDPSKSPDILWRIPAILDLPDYSDEELYCLLVRLFKRRSLVVEGGFSDRCMHVAVKRAARGRGSHMYGNARTVQTVFEEILARQAVRLQWSRLEWAKKKRDTQKSLQEADDRSGDEEIHQPDHRFVARTDIYGPGPPDVGNKSQAWRKLQAMVGLESVKSSIKELIGRAQYNYHREIQGEEPLNVSLNCVFVGPPGTGKSTVAKLYGQVISDLGLLSNGDIIVKGPSDFMSIGSGDPGSKTASILSSSQGKVLIIDGAHALFNVPVPRMGYTNPTSQSIIQTIAEEVTGAPNEDRCVILTGYPHEMEEMIRDSDAGLCRRFPDEQTFHLRDYDQHELAMILESKLAEYGLSATDKAKRVAGDVLSNMRRRPNFGNGRDVENLVSRARAQHRKRILDPSPPDDEKSVGHTGVVLEPEDFDPDFDRPVRTDTCQSLFSDFIGFEKIINIFQGYQDTAAGMRGCGVDPRPHIPFGFVFKGPPGTGKTSTARKVGRIFYDMGLLSTDEVVECSATDLVGQWMGHTGPKVLNLLNKALGKVLFVDEAHRLNSRNMGTYGTNFQQEAIGELVDAMTKPRYAQKILIILAGYDEEMDQLMDVNPGLRSRFATHIVFPPMQPEHCLYRLLQEIRKLNVEVCDEADPGDAKTKKMYRLFSRLSETKNWANGRDIESLARTILAHVFGKHGRDARKNRTRSRPLAISTNELIRFLKDMLRERKRESDEE